MESINKKQSVPLLLPQPLRPPPFPVPSTKKSKKINYCKTLEKKMESINKNQSVPHQKTDLLLRLPL